MARERARGGRRGAAARRLRHPRGRSAVAVGRPDGDRGRRSCGLSVGHRVRAALRAAAPRRPLRRSCRSCRLVPAPSASPSVPAAPEAGAAPVAPVAPAASARRAAALAAAAQRVAAAAAVRRALPAFDQLAASMVARSGVPGAAVAVVAGDTAMYTRCFGLREIGRPDPVDAGTLFQLGGVSQAYTTTLLAALAGEGELHWDQPLRRVWPGFRLQGSLGLARGHVPRPDGGAQRPAGVRRQRAARLRLRPRRDPAAAALPAPGRRLPRRVRAAGGARHGGGRRRRARHRRLLGPAAAGARARAHRRRRHRDRLPGLRDRVRQGDAAPAGGRLDGPAGTRRTRQCSRRLSG